MAKRKMRFEYSKGVMKLSRKMGTGPTFLERDGLAKARITGRVRRSVLTKTGIKFLRRKKHKYW